MLSLIWSLVSLFLHSPIAQASPMPDIQAWLKSESPHSIEEFLSKLPDDELRNFTLMHDSKSLQQASAQNPRAILYGDDGQWVITFNGDASQMGGDTIEMMIRDDRTHSYGFHELTFREGRPILKLNSKRCEICHGIPTRPIWDHYDQWPGAYGERDDQFSQQELDAMAKFIAAAPTHPRYRYLKDLEKGYRFEHEGILYAGYTIDRDDANRNRQLTLRLYEQRYDDIADQLSVDPRFSSMKPILFYFLARCYKNPATKYVGDGENFDEGVIQNLFADLVNGKDSQTAYPSKPFALLDELLSRLGVDPRPWYLNSRALPSYRVMDEGSDVNTASITAHLLHYAPEYRDEFALSEMPDPVYIIPMATPILPGACVRFTREARVAAQAFKTPLLTPVSKPRPVSLTVSLPQICLKCHTTEPAANKIFLPLSELPARISNGDRVLLDRLREAVTPDETGTSWMPKRSPGDALDYEIYMKSDAAILRHQLDLMDEAAVTEDRAP